MSYLKTASAIEPTFPDSWSPALGSLGVNEHAQEASLRAGRKQTPPAPALVLRLQQPAPPLNEAEQSRADLELGTKLA